LAEPGFVAGGFAAFIAGGNEEADTVRKLEREEVGAELPSGFVETVKNEEEVPAVGQGFL
jgi:hypothetical protein